MTEVEKKIEDLKRRYNRLSSDRYNAANEDKNSYSRLMSKVEEEINSLEEIEIDLSKLNEQSSTEAFDRVGLKSKGNLLHESIRALDAYLNAGCKTTRKQASIKAKECWAKYYGVPYENRKNDSLERSENQ